MHETYRMLGKEHETELERAALKHRLASEARGSRRPAIRPEPIDRGDAPGRRPRSRIAVYLLRFARAED